MTPGSAPEVLSTAMHGESLVRTQNADRYFVLRHLLLAGSAVRTPLLHEQSALLKQVATCIRPFNGTPHGVGKAQLHDRMIGICLLAGPGPKGTAEAVDRCSIGEAHGV